MAVDKKGYDDVLLDNTSDIVEDPDFAYFEGWISTKNVSHSYTRQTTRTLQGMADKAKEGVKVLPEHQSSSPIGRSIDSRYDAEKGATRAKFKIQKGIKLASREGYETTDDYIKAAKAGTIDNLSAGYFVNEVSCDHCKKDMRSYSILGMTFMECENGHYPGQKLYMSQAGREYKEPGKGRTEKRVIANIEDSSLIEFSVVGFGNVPGSEIIQEKAKEAYDQNLLEEKHLVQLSDRYQINFEGGNVISPITNNRGINVDVKELQGQIAELEKENAGLTKQMNDKDDLIRTQKNSIDRHGEEIDEFKVTVIELESRVKELQPVEDQNTSLLEENAKLQKQLEEHKAESFKVDQFNKMYKDVVEEAVSYYDRTASYTPEQIRVERERLLDLNNYNTLCGYRDEYKAQWARRYQNARLSHTAKEDRIDYDRLR